MAQDKQKEVCFFDQFGEGREYNVFTADSNLKLIRRAAAFGGFKAGSLIADLGCGSGVFTQVLKAEGYRSFGLDLSQGLLHAGRRHHPELDLLAGDAESLPLAPESLDGVLLSGIVHHLPDPSACALEIYRVLKPGGAFVAFDPNRRNPFMYLYRDRSSPFYSRQGVTENERPIIAEETAAHFAAAGFSTKVDYLSGLAYRYLASTLMRLVLPLYNAVDALLFWPGFMRRWRPFVLLSGVKE